MPDTKPPIEITIDNFKLFLLEKNKRYGNSALEPLKVFAKDIPDVAGILVRLDDKLSRIRNATELRKNDTADIIGYLFLLCIIPSVHCFSNFQKARKYILLNSLMSREVLCL